MIGLGIGINRGRVASQAQRDLSAYALRLRLLGAPLSDTKYQELKAFSKALYAAYGRTDFWDLSRNAGTGPAAYSFHGVAAILTNNAVWTSGVLDIWTVTGGQPQGSLTIANVSKLPAKTFFSVSTPTLQNALGISMVHCEGPTTADSEITQSYRMSDTTLNPYFYTPSGTYSTAQSIGAPINQILSSGFAIPTSNTLRLNKNGINHADITLPGNMALNPATTVTRFFRTLGASRILGRFILCDKDKVMDAAVLHSLVKTHLFPTLP